MSGIKDLRSRLFGKRTKKDDNQPVGSPSSSQSVASLERVDKTLDTLSSARRTREAAIILLDFGIIVSEATDVLKPMKVVCGFLKKVLEVAKVSISRSTDTVSFTKFKQSVEQVDKDWSGLISTIRLHIATVESQTSSLEEDQSIDESPPPLNTDIEKPLQDYIRLV
jgi:hypothetical protein